MSDETEKPARSGTAAGFDNERVSEPDNAESTPPQAVAQRADTDTTIKADLLNSTSTFAYAHVAQSDLGRAARDVLVECEQRMLGMQLQYGATAIDAAKVEVHGLCAQFDPLHCRIQVTIFDAHTRDLATTPTAIALTLVHDPELVEQGGVEYLCSMFDFALAAPNARIQRYLIRQFANTWRVAKQKHILATRGVQVGEAFLHGDSNALQDAADLADAIRSLDAVSAKQAVLSSAEFVRGFVPPDYVIDGILQRGFLYSNTGPTHSGKTAIALRLAAHVALSRPIGGHDVEQGKVLFLVGENPVDVQMRWIALEEQMGFLADEIDVYFRPGVGLIADLMPELQQKASEVGGFALVVVDTAAAFFDGDNENDNVQQGDYARRLRTLTGLHGNPCVLVNCHPTKNAGPDNLLPRGGGAFVAEVDGNTCCKAVGSVTDLHWQGKFRGPDFAPIPFELITVTSDRLKNSKGKIMPTVYAKPLTEPEKENRETAASRDQEKLLVAMYENPRASVADLAISLHWFYAGGGPAKSRVHRLLEALSTLKLAVKVLGHWVPTPAGEKLAKNLANIPTSE